MIYPSTYNEMFAWVGIKKLRSFFELTNEQAEELYESLRTKQSRQITGYPNGVIVKSLNNGAQTQIKSTANMDPNVYESVTVSPTGVVMTYTAAYLAAQAASRSSSGGSGSNNNNNNNNNNN